MYIMILKKQSIEIMAQGGQILSKIMRELKDRVEPGIMTKELDKLAQELIFNSKAKPAFKNYRGFPAALCTSINEQVVHALPSSRILKDGDILSLDLGIIYQGFYTDMAITLAIGSVEPEINRMIKATKKSLKRAIARCKPGKTIGDLGHAIQKHVEDQGFQVVRELCGHGIGRKLHQDPEILNFGQRHKGLKLEPGMVLAIEPMVVMGNPGIKKGPDGFCYQTADNSWSAHFEHTIAITEKDPWVLTR